jgi:hypothetical protein
MYNAFTNTKVHIKHTLKDTADDVHRELVHTLY